MVEVETAFESELVRAAFDAMPDKQCGILLGIRERIFTVNAVCEETLNLTEALRWGQPSYLTLKPKTGSTIRLGILKTGEAALFAHCQTSLIKDFSEIAAPSFRFEGNRAILLEAIAAEDMGQLDQFIASALTYHLKR